MVAAGGVMPGRPVDDHRRFVLHEGERLPKHHLIGAPHALRVDDAFRNAGAARGEQEFRNRVGADSVMRGVDLCGRRGAELVEHCRALERVARHHDFDTFRNDGLNRARECIAIGGEYESGRDQFNNRAQPAKIFRHQRIGRRDRRIGNAGIKRTEAKQRVLDIVAGKDYDGPLGRQIARQQRLADGARLLQCLRIGHFAPCALRVALRKENAIRRDVRPMHQPLGDLVRVRPKRLRRAQQQAAVGALLDDHVLRPERDLAQRRGRALLLAGRRCHLEIAITAGGGGSR